MRRTSDIQKDPYLCDFTVQVLRIRLEQLPCCDIIPLEKEMVTLTAKIICYFDKQRRDTSCSLHEQIAPAILSWLWAMLSWALVAGRNTPCYEDPVAGRPGLQASVQSRSPHMVARIVLHNPRQAIGYRMCLRFRQ